MVVYSDSIEYAEQVIPHPTSHWTAARSRVSAELQRLSVNLYGDKPLHESTVPSDLLWDYLFVVESAPRSHYDLLVELSREATPLPDGVLCLAGAGQQFHGFKNRPWAASPGNIHLSAHLAPSRPISHAGVAFTILAAVSVIDVLDSTPGLQNRAGIKWVNDVLIDGAKVCGVLAYTQTMDETVNAAVIGIGLNVETTPAVEPTPSVPRVGSLRDFAPDLKTCNQRVAFDKLIQALDHNYRLLVDGRYEVLLERYRRRSLVIGRHVAICSETSGGDPEVIAKGRVTALGDDLELYLEGFEKPFSHGRLLLEPEPRANPDPQVRTQQVR
ncbi:MAG: biotin--[acetyl-CoA-carboxylase] ligase [Gemmatimonadales bacterium]|nr:biotin--[acetyl-CoA-carboxylase] ligase [Gemmatimonadales bacterium]NIN10519.1 biotin--[acetyl-CoA-carboxylase] ligase [Gemmatimonadales bacterium]NIN49306.1 biotin--[acetyl-CoA-carboxylase] ligase [Gemmatimonadales bacterium]NIP06770.1 biotin--[acetyl-CoA-carboxylase] ligase [Gemmatimonadales bacterium]NIR02796.1 biotin--[acetyl-CoA-carboxylase] ligase [Gemmatimonadales bacterium]